MPLIEISWLEAVMDAGAETPHFSTIAGSPHAAIPESAGFVDRMS
jgi:hypothetical protein